ncbi:MAG: bifunctional sulfate adenylyltransferase/adenylylsulfate kinase [Desulforegulaceae bacterium]|nr:bifunctional sulfate adenylyltransferase/adenylylsulfate kinase [Desulforegulaceae bacterium]
MSNKINPPYKGKLLNLTPDEDEKIKRKEKAGQLVQVALSKRSMLDFELIANGGLSPLNGFMNKKDYDLVLEKMETSTGLFWPLPICLDIDQKTYEAVKNQKQAALTDEEGFQLAIIEIEDIWKPDKSKEAIKLFNTENSQHPGIKYLKTKTKEYYLGGTLRLIELPVHYDFKLLRFSPSELRQKFIKSGWKNIAGFQTRHPLHRLQFELCMNIIKENKKKLLIHQIAGETKPEDFDRYTRIRATQKIIDKFPVNSSRLNILPLYLRFAGYKDALFHSIISKNYGCSDLIVGHGHSNPIFKDRSGYFYDNELIKKQTYELSKEIGINIIPVPEMRYVYFEEEYQFIDQIPESNQSLSISGEEIRKRIKLGKNIPSWASFPEVLEEIEKNYPPPSRQGFTIFCTGLPSAGKSTIAKVLYSKFLEIGKRPVTLLDGDIVRRNLSNELNFSKEHRNINVERIGFVANEITKNRGIAICAPIAPYSETREKIRELIEPSGGFIEVFVSTPLNVCEERDRKGMYEKAKKGFIKDFTGVDDPYEIPENPEVIIDTTANSPEECAQMVIQELIRLGYL